MSKREEEIENTIRNVVFMRYFPLYTKEANEKARDILRKFFMKDYIYLDNMETKRLIAYNLMYVERQLKNEQSVAMYTLQLKKDMDSIPNYKIDFTAEYCNMLSFYLDSEYIKLTKQEKLKQYEFCYNHFKKSYEDIKSKSQNQEKIIDVYLKMINFKFNIDKINSNFITVLEIIKDLHNIKHPQVQSYIELMLCDIKKIDKNLYSKALDIINTIELVDCI